MPLYEFQCEKCEHRFEKIQSFSAPDPECPKCGGRVQRLLHAPAVQFKGSGWYVTDYAKSGSSNPKSDGKPASSNEGSFGAKTETKGESKSETKTNTGGTKQ